MKCEWRIAGGWECPREATFVFASPFDGRTWHSCADHRHYDSQEFFPKGHPIEPARGVRRASLRDMAMARHFACMRRGRSDCSKPCPWYAPLRRLTRCKREERAR
jgi:hypothetical protein